MERATDYSVSQIVQLIQAHLDRAVDQAEWIGSGQWSDCFAFTLAGNDYVFRVGAHGEDFRKDRVAGDFASGALPIPKVVAYGAVDTDYFAISERVFGEPLEASSSWETLVPAVVDVLEALRVVDLGAFTGWGRWDSDRNAPASSWTEFVLAVNQDPVESRVHGWRVKLDTLPGAAEAFEHGYEQLAALATNDVPRALIHNDLINRNAHQDRGQITGIFDWGNSAIGDPLYDLGLIIMWQPWRPDIRPEPVIEELHRRWNDSELDTEGFAARLKVCLLHIGLEHIGFQAFLENWNEPQVVADRMTTVVAQDWL